LNCIIGLPGIDLENACRKDLIEVTGSDVPLEKRTVS
jgi:hypothetical protein